MKRIGFTLIELLGVIAITTLFLSVLFSFLNEVKQSARKLACGSNMKQLYVSLSIYDNANGSLPHGFNDYVLFSGSPPDICLGDASYDYMGLWWLQVASDAVSRSRQKTEVWCPSNKLKNTKLGNIVLCGNYGINRSICKDAMGPVGSEWVGKPLSLGSINSSFKTLLIVDSGYSIISWKGASNLSGPVFDNPCREEFFYVPGISENANRVLSDDAINGRHSDKTVNVIFVDGHLESSKADSLFVEEIGGTYRNQTPLWLPK